MKEILKADVLRESDTTQNVKWFDDQGPFYPHGKDRRYIVVEGKRYEMSQLNTADWLILNALYPNGPTVLH